MTVNKISVESYPFRNPGLSLEARINDLISRLKIEEKIALIPAKQAAVERLNIKAYSVGGEAAHGWVSRDGDKATVFPQPIGLACSWDTKLLEGIGSAIGDEARAYHKKKNTGLTLWAPTVDLERDPRWGRTEEAYGEDPLLTGQLSTALVKGMQGEHPFYLKMAAALKHFYANNNEADRCYCSVSVDPRNMREYYWKAFKPAIVKGKVCCIMTAYNEINGTPCILNKDVKNVVKEQWGLEGFVVADGADFSQTVTMHKYYDNHADSITDTLKSGVDCIPDEPELIIISLKEALEKDLLKESDIDRALKNIFKIRFRLGEFDPPENNPYSDIDESIIACQKHNQLALKAAQESIVLLKNEKNMLPLNKDSIEKIAVIGPLGDIIYRDWYTGELPYQVTPLEGIKNKLSNKEVLFTDACDQVSIKSLANNKYVYPAGDKKALIAAGGNLSEDYLYDFSDWGWGRNTLKSHSNGKFVTSGDNLTASADQVYGWFVRELYNFQELEDGSYHLKTWDKKNVYCDKENYSLKIDDNTKLDKNYKFIKNIEKSGIEEAVKAAREADIAIVCLGNHPLVNGKEEIDREDIILAPAQEELLKEVYAANPNTVLLTISSYPIALNWAKENIPAIIYSSHAGQETGNAIADVLFGDYSPAGRLAMTWFKSVEQLPDIKDYDIIKGKRTYMYFDQEVLYPFGYGLTYTQFKYSDLKINQQNFYLDDDIEIECLIKNVGSVRSDEVVQLYLKIDKSRVKRPLKELTDFKRINLEAGESKKISFKLNTDDFSFWDVTRNKYCVEKGNYQIMIGNSSQDIRLSETIQIEGEVIPPRDLWIITEAINYDDYQGIILDEIENHQVSGGGSCVKFLKKGDWILFQDVDFDLYFKKFSLIASSNFENVSLELRINDPEGLLLAKQIIPAQMDKIWEEKSCQIKKISGKQDLYLIATGPCKVKSVRLY